MFDAIKLAINADSDKYSYAGYGIGFDSRSLFSLQNFDWGKNVIFGVDNSSSVHIHNKKKDILVLREGPTQGLDNTIITTAKYSINFTGGRKKFCFSLHYNGSNSFFNNAKKIYKFKTKTLEIKPYLLCLGNIKNNFTVNKMKKKQD